MLFEHIQISTLPLFSKAFPEALFGILSREATEDVHSENQFAVLADKLKIMDEGVRYEQLFGVGEGYVVTGFSKDKKGIGEGRCNGKTGFEIRNEILKYLLDFFLINVQYKA